MTTIGRTCEEWDRHFLSMAQTTSQMSKDPSTKVGAVITHACQIISTGYNGFPAGIEDTEERLHDRETKYGLIIHAELNAILQAKCDLKGTTIYTFPFPPCKACALPIIQSGVSRVVAPNPSEELMVRWGVSLLEASILFGEADVMVTYWDPL